MSFASFAPTGVKRAWVNKAPWLCPLQVENMSNDLAGVWEVALSDGVHRIEFEHGTTTGKRVIFVDGKV